MSLWIEIFYSSWRPHPTRLSLVAMTPREFLRDTVLGFEIQVIIRIHYEDYMKKSTPFGKVCQFPLSSHFLLAFPNLEGEHFPLGSSLISFPKFLQPAPASCLRMNSWMQIEQVASEPFSPFARCGGYSLRPDISFLIICLGHFLKNLPASTDKPAYKPSKH